MASDWGGANYDEALPANQWTNVGVAGGNNPVGVSGNYGFLLIGTIVVTGGTQDGTIKWRVYPGSQNPDISPVWGSSPPITVHAGDTVSIPLAGSYALSNVSGNTGVGFYVDVFATTPMTIRGGGQGPTSGGDPCTVLIGMLLPYHEH